MVSFSGLLLFNPQFIVASDLDIEWEQTTSIPNQPNRPQYAPYHHHHSAQQPTKETPLFLILFIAELHYELFNLMISYLHSEIFNHLFIA